MAPFVVRLKRAVSLALQAGQTYPVRASGYDICCRFDFSVEVTLALPNVTAERDSRRGFVNKASPHCLSLTFLRLHLLLRVVRKHSSPCSADSWVACSSSHGVSEHLWMLEAWASPRRIPLHTTAPAASLLR